MSPRARATLSAFALFASFVVSSSVGAPHPSLPPPVIPECLGVNIHFTDPKPGEMEMLAAAGFKWVRMDFAWAATERAKGEYDFAAYDRLVAHLDKHQLRALFILDYGNPLYDDGLPPRTDESRTAFAAWAAAAVSHFAGKGYLWEMWNEPNLAQFWKPKPDVQQYIALAKITAAALKKAAPDEAFIGPATSTIDLSFLEACCQAGLLESWAGVSVHPYRQTAPETAEEELRSVRLLIRKYAPKDKAPGDIPVISGEWGYSSAWKDFDEEKQAKYAARQLLNNIANDVALSIWYDWRDDGTDPKEAEHHFGLVHHEYHEGRNPVYDPKPAYQVVKTLTQQLAGMRFNKRLIPDLARQSGVLDLFTSEGEIRVAAWTRQTTAPPPTPQHSAAFQLPLRDEVLLPISPGSIESIDIVGKRQIAHQATMEGLRFELTDKVEYLRPDTANDLLGVAAAWERAPLEFYCAPPKQDRLVLKLVNPLDKALRINGSEQEFSAGATIPTGSDATPWTRLPGASFSDSHPEFRLRHAYVDLIAPQRAVLSQRFIAVVTNPVRARILPRIADALPVEIENPSGQAWEGNARYLRFGDPEAGTEAKDFNAGRIALAQGERSRTLKLPLQPPAGEMGAFLQIWEAAPDDALMLPIPVPVIWPSSDKLKVSLEGDRVNATFAKDDEAPLSPSGSPSIRLRYSFVGGWKFLRLFTSETLSIPQTSRHQPTQSGLWLHGDGKGCQARIRFTDATGQTFQPDGPKIDWTGWLYITFPMQSTEEKPLAHWGGANDGVIHYPIKWDSIFLLDDVSRQPVEGEIYLSAPTLIY